MKIVFYSTRCPQCRILENMMTRAKIEYEECNDIDVMNSKGIMSAVSYTHLTLPTNSLV